MKRLLAALAIIGFVIGTTLFVARAYSLLTVDSLSDANDAQGLVSFIETHPIPIGKDRAFRQLSGFMEIDDTERDRLASIAAQRRDSAQTDEERTLQEDIITSLMAPKARQLHARLIKIIKDPPGIKYVKDYRSELIDPKNWPEELQEASVAIYATNTVVFEHVYGERELTWTEFGSCDIFHGRTRDEMDREWDKLGIVAFAFEGRRKIYSQVTEDSITTKSDGFRNERVTYLFVIDVPNSKVLASAEFVGPGTAPNNSFYGASADISGRVKPAENARGCWENF